MSNMHEYDHLKDHNDLFTPVEKWEPKAGMFLTRLSNPQNEFAFVEYFPSLKRFGVNSVTHVLDLGVLMRKEHESVTKEEVYKFTSKLRAAILDKGCCGNAQLIGELVDTAHNKFRIPYKNVIIISSPISERMWSEGDSGQIDLGTNKIRVGGNWYDFDDRWEVKPDPQLPQY